MTRRSELPPVRPKGKSTIRYKVVETSTVTDDRLEEILNTVTAEGWHYDSIQFVRTEASKRPTMAFVLFSREVGADEED